ncbi:hypothetical protein BC628DRAFT_582815 [Trametes gibbosa]|nr:hypothetical protein BC628DRAFT_582815 [Trametes gibbosa]
MSPRPNTSHRNVVLGGHDGTVLAGFYQYGAVSWKTLFEWLAMLFQATNPWIIVADDRLTHSEQQFFPTNDVVTPGKYTVLAPDRSAIHIDLVPTHARPQLSALYRERTTNLDLHARSRHKNCLSSEDEVSWCRLQAAHILSASRPASKRCKAGSSQRITESGTGLTSSPSTKSSSLRNMLFLRDNLHDAWAEYEFGIAPDDDYRIIPFVSGHDAIAGQFIEMDAMTEPGTRPFDQLLRDHFKQGLLKHVKGSGERHWDFGNGSTTILDAKMWGMVEAKDSLDSKFDRYLGQGVNAGAAASTHQNTAWVPINEL